MVGPGLGASDNVDGDQRQCRSNVHSWPQDTCVQQPTRRDPQPLQEVALPGGPKQKLLPGPLSSEGGLQSTHCGMTLAAWMGREVPGEVPLWKKLSLLRRAQGRVKEVNRLGRECQLRPLSPYHSPGTQEKVRNEDTTPHPSPCLAPRLQSIRRVSEPKPISLWVAPLSPWTSLRPSSADRGFSLEQEDKEKVVPFSFPPQG